jgi:hypothetical protein
MPFSVFRTVVDNAVGRLRILQAYGKSSDIDVSHTSSSFRIPSRTEHQFSSRADSSRPSSHTSKSFRSRKGTWDTAHRQDGSCERHWDGRRRLVDYMGSCKVEVVNRTAQELVVLYGRMHRKGHRTVLLYRKGTGLDGRGPGRHDFRTSVHVHRPMYRNVRLQCFRQWHE